jgi:hypothetical protein
VEARQEYFLLWQRWRQVGWRVEERVLVERLRVRREVGQRHREERVLVERLRVRREVGQRHRERWFRQT